MDPIDLRATLADKLRNNEAINAETLNMVCFMLSREIENLALTVPEAGPLSRTLLRVVGRVVIDTGGPGATAETWPDTKEMALQWIDEARGQIS